MINKKIVLSTVLLFLLLFGIGGYFLFYKEPYENEDARRFAGEYHEVSEDNVFVYKTSSEIISIMEHGTGVVYLGYPECPWCQEYVKYLNEVALEVGLDVIYYGNTKSMKEEHMDHYEKIISILDGHLQYTDEGKQWIYVPNVSFHVDGKIILNDFETSKDTHNLKNPKDYWTVEEIEGLKTALRDAMKKVKEKKDSCTDCNR